jgi:hypothetical protein
MAGGARGGRDQWLLNGTGVLSMGSLGAVADLNWKIIKQCRDEEPAPGSP